MRVLYVLRNVCITRAKATILKGSTRLDAQILLELFKKKKKSLSVIPKETRLPFTSNANAQHMFRMTVLEHAVFLPAAKATVLILFQFFFFFYIRSNVLFIHTQPQKNKYDNQALMKHLAACSPIKGIIQRQLHIQNVCTNSLTYKE